MNLEIGEGMYTKNKLLNGKKILCSCKHCGATIEKKEYFSGKMFMWQNR